MIKTFERQIFVLPRLLFLCLIFSLQRGRFAGETGAIGRFGVARLALALVGRQVALLSLLALRFAAFPAVVVLAHERFPAVRLFGIAAWIAPDHRNAKQALEGPCFPPASEPIEFHPLRVCRYRFRLAPGAVGKQQELCNCIHFKGNAWERGTSKRPLQFSLRNSGDSFLRKKLVSCPDSYWLRIDEYLKLAKDIRQEGRRRRARERADFEIAASEWEDLARENLDFLTHVSRERNRLQK